MTNPIDAGGDSSSDSGKPAMPRKKLDLLVLTFNAAKHIIDGNVFAHHLETALSTNATTSLPELVVFSLQEISPLSYAFIGGVFLNPFLARYEDALNVAAVKVQSTPPTTPAAATDDADTGAGPATTTDPVVELRPSPQTDLSGSSHGRRRPYTLVRQHNVGMTAIMLFARHPDAVSQVELAEVGFGTMDMGNKGAVGVRLVYTDRQASREEEEGAPPHTQLTFVATHLAPMEWNLRRRNANWRTICQALLFEEPIAVLKRAAAAGGSGGSNDDDDEDEEDGALRRLIRRSQSPAGPGVAGAAGGRARDSAATKAPTAEEEEEAERLLLEAERDNGGLAAHVRSALRDATILRPGSRLFLAGDLNYRISDRSPEPGEPFPSLEGESPNHWSTFLARDQLTRERLAGRALQGLEEAGPLGFPPTYKYDVLPSPEGAANEEEARRAEARGEAELVVPWRFAKHRWPSWTDRVLYSGGGCVGPEEMTADDDGFEVKAYRSLPLMRSSDHQPVFLRVEVPVLSPAELGRRGGLVGTDVAAAAEAGENDGQQQERQQQELLYPVDLHAAARRRAARSREFVTGWTMLLWCTREGALALGSLAVLGVSTYWLYNVL